MQTEKIIKHIVNWLEIYLDNSKQDGFIVGISGGIDSAVVSTLCAMTNRPTLCLELNIHGAETNKRALNHIQWLEDKYRNVNGLSVDLTSVYDQFTTQVQPSQNTQLNELSLANTRARLRMTTLYYYAGINRALVVGTGNKVEDFGIGFFTKYGDGGVDISPIADLMKSEVYQIAEFLKIIQEIQSAAPTDGLFGDNRSDEDQIGASYDELEWAMNFVEENQTNPNLTERQQEVLRIYKHRNLVNLHKMLPIPICKIPKEWK